MYRAIFVMPRARHAAAPIFHATLLSNHSSPVNPRLTSPDVPSSTQLNTMQRNKEKEKGKSCTAKHVSRKETEGLLWMPMTNDVENVIKSVQTSLCDHVPALFRDQNVTGNIEYLFVRIRLMMP